MNNKICKIINIHNSTVVFAGLYISSFSVAEADPTAHSHVAGGTSTLGDLWSNSAAEECVVPGMQNSLTAFFTSL